MNQMKRTACLLALALAVVLSACAAPSNAPASGTPAPSPKAAFPGTPGADMVTLNITSEPQDLNSFHLTETISQSVLYHCMSGLTRLNDKDEPVADVAESWDISEDMTVYTVRLRQDAKWSNGDPVTAHDFYYGWVMQMTPSTGSISANSLYDNIENGAAFYNGTADASELGIKVLDDYTLEIRWSRPMPNGLFHLAQFYCLPMNQAAYESIGEANYAKEPDQMVTNGPYRITEWIHSSHLMLEKVEDHYDAASISIPKAKLAIIGDANTGLNAFMAGEIDMCSLYSEQIALLEKEDPNAVGSYVDGGTWFLNFNLEHGPLSNVNLRRALAHSIDVQSLLDYVINDGSVAADGLVPNGIAGAGGTPYAQARGSLFQYDKEAANRYLEQALTELNLDKSQLKLDFWGTDTTYNQNQAAYLQQQWKDNLGLDISLITVPYKAHSEAKTSGEYSFTVGGWGPSENDASSFLNNYQTGDPNNTGSYSNPEYDRLMQAAAQEGDPQKRQDMMIAAEKLLLEDMAVGPLYFTCTKYAVSNKLVGLTRTPFQYFNFYYATIQQ